MARKRYDRKAAYLEKRLRKTIFLIILIPSVFAVAFLFFGPQMGALFGFVSVNRRSTGPGDTVAPPAPIFDNTPSATKDKTIEIFGFAESGSTIKLFVNGPEKYTTVTTTDGQFSFADVELIDGRNTIFAKATDASGNESDKSQTITITVDTKKPEIEITTPEEGDVLRNLNERITVKGTINEKATITVNERFAVQKPDNTFEVLLGVKEGEVKIIVIAEDEAGNSETEEITVTYLKQSN